MKARLLCLVFCLLATCGNVGASSTDVYDGQWWLSINERQRMNFLYGYVTCANGLAKLDVRFDESVLTYAPRLTTYLKEHPEASTDSVEKLLWKIANPPYSRMVKHPGKGEDVGDWGGMDGDEWRNASEAEQNVLIRGFLECYMKRTKQEQGTFSRPIEYYVAAITKWYGTRINPDDPDDHSQVDPKKVDTKVPEVLFRFRDPARKTQEM